MTSVVVSGNLRTFQRLLVEETEWGHSTPWRKTQKRRKVGKAGECRRRKRIEGEDEEEEKEEEETEDGKLPRRGSLKWNDRKGG